MASNDDESPKRYRVICQMGLSTDATGCDMIVYFNRSKGSAVSSVQNIRSVDGQSKDDCRT